MENGRLAPCAPRRSKIHWWSGGIVGQRGEAAILVLDDQVDGGPAGCKVTIERERLRRFRPPRPDRQKAASPCSSQRYHAAPVWIWPRTRSAWAARCPRPTGSTLPGGWGLGGHGNGISRPDSVWRDAAFRAHVITFHGRPTLGVLEGSELPSEFRRRSGQAACRPRWRSC